jgi:hypothetical protein
MQQEVWVWADLDARKLALVQETERTLGADYVLAYRKGDPRRDEQVSVSLKPAALDASQLDCLLGVERKTNLVVVAYRRD